MLRLQFSKTGDSVWISHLDTMRLFQRAFKRSGFHLKHTQGFNPRPSVSIAMPLSVGIESFCELLDFELEDNGIDCTEIRNRLNQNLIDGIQVVAVYRNGSKIKCLKHLQCEIDLDYDNIIPEPAVDAVRELFQNPEIWVDKKNKNGITSQNIVPMIHSIECCCLNEHTLRLSAVICCQDPSLNPLQLSAAVAKYLPEYKPNFVRCRRLEVLDAEYHVFR